MKKNVLYIMAVFSVSLLMASCMLGKKYSQPDLKLPDESNNATDTLLLADLKWSEIYLDKKLQLLINKAIASNKDMVVAVARIDELKNLRRINTSAMLPDLTGKLYADREWEDYRGEKATRVDQLDAKLSLNWELDLWGNLRWAKQKSVAEYLQSVETKRAVQMTIVAEIARVYFELTALDHELAIVKQTLATREEGVKQARIRFEGGLTSETSYQQAQVELASTAVLIPDLKSAISQKESEIALLCGEYPNEIERTGLGNMGNIPDYLPTNLSSELLMRRPDVRAAEQSLIAANATVGIAYTDRFPRIALTGTYGFENDEISTFLQAPYKFLSATLTTPIFHFNAKRARYRASQAAYVQETARYEKTVLTVFKEINDAIVTYNSAKESRELRENLEQASRNYVKLAQLQYLNGVIIYLDVLDAQRKYFDAQIGLTNAIRDEYIAIVELYKALGGGW